MKTAEAKPPAKKVSKAKNPSLTLVQAVEALLDKAMSAPAPTTLTAMSEDKLFEVFALAKLLYAFKLRTSGNVKHVPPSGGKATNVVVALSPASANGSKFSHFDLSNHAGDPVGEAWVSLEVQTLSWRLSGALGAPPASRHELDVALVDPQSGLYPSFERVQVAVSCKNVAKATKEQVREALGLRRETALLSSPCTSRAPWLVSPVPANPASPLLLVSSDPGVKIYRQPVDRLGVYVRYIHFKR